MSVIWRFSLLYHFTCSSFYFLNVYHIHLCIFKLSLNFFCHTFFVYNLARSGIQRTRNLLVSIRKLPNHDFLDKIHILKIDCCLQIFIILIKPAFLCYCVCLESKTLFPCRFSLSSSCSQLLPNIRENRGIFYRTSHLIQYAVSEIQFRSVKCTAVTL